MSSQGSGKKPHPSGVGGAHTQYGKTTPSSQAGKRGKKQGSQQSAKKKKGRSSDRGADSQPKPKIPVSSSEPLPTIATSTSLVSDSHSDPISELIAEDHSLITSGLSPSIKLSSSPRSSTSPKLSSSPKLTGSMVEDKTPSEDYGVARRLLSFTRGSGEERDSDVCESTAGSSTQTNSVADEVEKPKLQSVPKQSSEDKSGDVEGMGDRQPISKAELKRQRREKQEAQRAAKQQKKADTVAKGSKGSQEIRVSANVQADDEKIQAKVAKKLAKQQIPQRTEAMKRVEMFSHLQQYRKDISVTNGLSFGTGGIHPAFIKLGLQYAEGVVCGSNARCIALLAAFKKVILDYSTPPEKYLSRDLELTIKPYISFLTQCRPLSVSMGNSIKYLKWKISTIPPDMPEDQAKSVLCQSLDDYYRAKIQLPDQVIVETTTGIIKEGDVILVYSFSSIVLKCLTAAHDKGKDFRVIVVDSRPKLEGREYLQRLVRHGVKCSYVLINAVSYIMKEVTKVLLGAHALLANGYVMSRVGTSLVALVAKTFNVPVLVCCETYKFCDRVQTDSFVFNELGDPNDIAQCDHPNPPLADWKDIQSLALLNLAYDVTSPDHIAMVITEKGCIPCTSVPVVLRVTKDEERAEIMRVASVK